MTYFFGSFVLKQAAKTISQCQDDRTSSIPNSSPLKTTSKESKIGFNLYFLPNFVSAVHCKGNVLTLKWIYKLVLNLKSHFRLLFHDFI